MNSTTTALARIASLPGTLLASITRPKISYVPAAHVKLKADNIATVFVCIVRQIWLYVEGFRDSRRRRNRADDDKAKDKQESKRQARRQRAFRKASRKVGKGRKTKIIAKGRYTLLLQ
jgi:hypothetical protein